MSRPIIVNDQMRAEFSRADEPAVVCTEDGTVLGYFSPTPPQKLNLQPQISEEELRRREEDTNCKLYTTEEVIAKLRSL